MTHLTVQTRGYCSAAGYARLDEVLGQLCELGNAALQERRDAWNMNRQRISYQDQCRSLTLVREDDPDGLGQLNVAAARGALQRIDRGPRTRRSRRQILAVRPKLDLTRPLAPPGRRGP